MATCLPDGVALVTFGAEAFLAGPVTMRGLTVKVPAADCIVRSM